MSKLFRACHGPAVRLVLAALPLLCACQSEPDCPVADAADQGRAAALADQDKTILMQEPATMACAAADPAWKLAWEKGWEQGFAQLCQGTSGWQMAREQREPWQICQQESNRFGSYLSAYRLARQIIEMEEEAGALRAQANTQQVTVEDSPFPLSTGLDKAQSARLRQLELDLVDLRVLAIQQGWLEEDDEMSGPETMAVPQQEIKSN